MLWLSKGPIHCHNDNLRNPFDLFSLPVSYLLPLLLSQKNGTGSHKNPSFPNVYALFFYTPIIPSNRVDTIPRAAKVYNYSIPIQELKLLLGTGTLSLERIGSPQSDAAGCVRHRSPTFPITLHPSLLLLRRRLLSVKGYLFYLSSVIAFSFWPMFPQSLS